MTTLRTLKKLLFGETLLMPLGIAATLAAGELVRRVAPHLWSRAGGLLMLGAVLALLAAAVGSAARRSRFRVP
jgi:hypothetical protein